MKLRLFGQGGRTWWYYMYLKSLVLTYRFKWNHRNFGGGKKPCDKIFYVIGIDFHDEGLMSIVNSVMTHIEYALDRGYTPVVDMKDFQSIYHKENENVWEYFFEQPCGYNLSDVYGARNIILSMNVQYPRGYSFEADNQRRIEKIRSIYKDFLRPNQNLQSYLEESLNTIKSCKEGVIACICRGTDYTNTIAGLPKQPTADMVIEKLKMFISKYGVSNIYCATEDKRIYSKFQEEFGDKLLPNTQQKYDDNKGKLLSKVNIEQGIDVYDIAFQYYKSLYIVTQCDYLVAGWVSGTRSVLLMPNHFKDVFVFLLGSVTEADLLNKRKQ